MDSSANEKSKIEENSNTIDYACGIPILYGDKNTAGNIKALCLIVIVIVVVIGFFC